MCLHVRHRCIQASGRSTTEEKKRGSRLQVHHLWPRKKNRSTTSLSGHYHVDFWKQQEASRVNHHVCICINKQATWRLTCPHACTCSYIYEKTSRSLSAIASLHGDNPRTHRASLPVIKGCRLPALSSTATAFLLRCDRYGRCQHGLPCPVRNQ
jgi:hypothetical protein